MMSFDDEQLQSFHHQLVAAILRTFWHPQSVLEYILDSLPPNNRRAKWPANLVSRLFTTFVQPPAPSVSQLQAFLQSDRQLAATLGRLKSLPKLSPLPSGDGSRPHPSLKHLDLPRVASRAALANCLSVPASTLAAFCEVRRPAEGVRYRYEHYHYRWLPKRYGSFRLIEAPKERLKEIQSRILQLILDRVPAHPAATAFLKGRSIGEALTMHVGQDVLFRIDLKDFFPSIGIGKVRKFFRHLGYPCDVAECLAKLSTNVAPRRVLNQVPELHRSDSERLARLYELPHLPQGAPTSPALSNLVAYRLDARLTGLAASFGANYSRYADDLFFSGDRRYANVLNQFQPILLSILIDEGYLIRRRKTRTMRRGRRQTSLGLVVNDKINSSRESFQTLKAILFNCIRFGANSQNHDRNVHFREHLHGRIAFHASVNPRRGEKLRTLFNQIVWPRTTVVERD